MDGNDPSLWATGVHWIIEHLITLLAAGAVGAVLMFIADRWLFGRKALADTKNRIDDLKKERDTERENRIATQAATEARLSILEAQLRAINQPASSSDSPSSISASEEAGDPLEDTRRMWLASPGAGYLASKLIMQVPTLEEVREIYTAFRSAHQREDTARANWAFLYRLEDDGHGTEVYEWAFTLAGEDDEIFSDEDTQGELLRWHKEALVNGA